MNFVRSIELGDPSSNKQTFINLRLKLLCCRYWYLELWDCHDMVFPFWRIYWNKNEGGELTLQDEIYTMTPNALYVISPFTSFSTRIKNNHKYNTGIHVIGKNLIDAHNESNYIKKYLLHFFTHFNLGTPFDNVFPGIFKIELTDHLYERLIYLTNKLKVENHDF